MLSLTTHPMDVFSPPPQAVTEDSYQQALIAEYRNNTQGTDALFAEWCKQWAPTDVTVNAKSNFIKIMVNTNKFDETYTTQLMELINKLESLCPEATINLFRKAYAKGAGRYRVALALRGDKSQMHYSQMLDSSASEKGGSEHGDASRMLEAFFAFTPVNA